MMTNRTRILEELVEISPAVANLEPVNVFRVPEGYFEGLAESILLRIKAMNAESEANPSQEAGSILDQARKSNPFKVEPGYFDSLAGDILSKIRKSEDSSEAAREIEELSPLLAGLRMKNVFTVPPGYFESFPDELSTKLHKEEVRVIPIRSVKRKWINYAAAALVTGIIAVGALITFKNQFGSNSSTAEINPKPPIENSFPTISDEALANFLNNSVGNEEPVLDSQETAASIALLDLDDNGVQDVLKGVSDNDIKDYLEENPAAGSSLTTN